MQECTGANDAAGAQPFCRVGCVGLLAVFAFQGVEAKCADSLPSISGGSSIASLRQRMCIARAAASSHEDATVSSHEAGRRPRIVYVPLA